MLLKSAFLSNIIYVELKQLVHRWRPSDVQGGYPSIRIFLYQPHNFKLVELLRLRVSFEFRHKVEHVVDFQLLA